jgi:predicted nucleotidyltransferase
LAGVSTGGHRIYNRAMPFTEDLQRALDDTSGVRLALVFGSAARGTARTGSDVDVAVLLDNDEDLPRLQVALERAVGRPVDLVSLRKAPPLLRFEIARDGRLLVEREPHAWIDFRARAMIDWWDWAPTARIMHDAMRARLEEEAGRGPS